MEKLKIIFIKLFVLITFLGGSIESSAQSSWVKIYEDSSSQFTSEVRQTSDGGYIIGGKTELRDVGIKYDILLVKVDSIGDTLWVKTYNQFDYDRVSGLEQTSDDGYIFGINSFSGSLIVKTNSIGDTLWTRGYADLDRILSVEQTADGGYMIYGSPATLLKTDANGDLSWVKLLGPSLGAFYTFYGQQAPNGDYVLFGEDAINKFGIVRTNSVGDTLWTFTDSSVNLAFMSSARLMTDGGYIVSGIDAFGSEVILKVASTQSIEWIHYPTSRLIINSIVESTLGGVAYSAIDSISYKLIIGELSASGIFKWEHSYSGEFAGVSDLNVTSDKHYILASSIGSEDANVYLRKVKPLNKIIEGHLFLDNDFSCSPNAGDINLSGHVIQAKLNAPGDVKFFGTTDSLGYYKINCEEGSYTVSIPQLSPYYSLNCPQNIAPIVSVPDDTINFPLSPDVLCPLMTVDLSVPLLRTTGLSSYTIQYCNHGTLDAQNVSIDVEFDPFLNIFNFSNPPVSQTANTYTFDVGNVSVGQCDFIYVDVVVDTSALFGQTHCSEAHIYPDSFCLSNLWSGMILDVDSECRNDSAVFHIQNSSSGPTTPRAFLVFEDDIIMRTGTINVPSTGSSEIKVSATPGKFYRIEIEQESGIPSIVRAPIASSFVEGCVLNSNGEFNTGFPLMFPNGSSNPFVSTDCQQNVGSFDPNNKRAQPEGYKESHFISENQFIDYQINFQNTGTDTAFLVYLIDSLSQYLDPSSVSLTSASHPYTWNINGNGVLEVRFENIMLPDSNVNEPASHGFAKFRIEQQPNNPIGTLINNFADIYFDYNTPVRTDTTYHEIGLNYYIKLDVYNPGKDKLKVNVFPNPFTHSTTIQIEEQGFRKLTLIVYDVIGREVKRVNAVNTNEMKLERGQLDRGIYVFKLLGDNKPISGGKIVVQ